MTLPDGFAAKVRTTDCQVWIGSTNSKGYGLVCVGDGKIELAHRIAYEHQYGPIPDGLVIDHLCRVRNCVNPLHLEAVTSGENQRRGRRAAGLQVGDTCSNGHEIREGDIYERPSGVTECCHCRRSTAHRPGRRRPTQQRRADRVAVDLAATERLARAG